MSRMKDAQLLVQTLKDTTDAMVRYVPDRSVYLSHCTQSLAATTIRCLTVLALAIERDAEWADRCPSAPGSE